MIISRTPFRISFLVEVLIIQDGTKKIMEQSLVLQLINIALLLHDIYHPFLITNIESDIINMKKQKR